MAAGLIACAILHALLVPGYRGAHRRAQQNLCFANQRTVAAAVEACEADKGRAIAALDDAVWGDLIRGDYLPTRPVCPRRWYESGGEYLLVRSSPEESPTVLCTRHGCIPNMTSGSPRAQLAALGVADPVVVSRCSDQDPGGPYPSTLVEWLCEPHTMFAGSVALIWMLVCLVAVPAVRRSSRLKR